MLCTIPHVGHAPTRWSIDRKSVPRDPADIDGLSVATLRAKAGAWRDEFYRIRHWPIDWNTSHGATPRLNAVREGRGRGYTRDVRLCATAASTRARRSGPGHPRGICSLTGNLASTTKSGPGLRRVPRAQCHHAGPTRTCRVGLKQAHPTVSPPIPTTSNPHIFAIFA